MTKKQSEDIDKIKLYISSLMNSEHDRHSKLINDLKDVLGKTQKYDEMCELLNTVYNSNIVLLDKIYKYISKIS